MLFKYFIFLFFFQKIIKYVTPEEIFKFICGNDPYRFFSHVPCEYYQVCPNGGFDSFIQCDINKQCTDVNPSLICVVNRCCTLPYVVGQLNIQSSSNINNTNIYLLGIIGLFIWIANDLF